jgi:hypothetical protein
VRVTFNELAERELNEAAQYYELDQPGLGVAFLTDVRRCTEAVVERRPDRPGGDSTPIVPTVSLRPALHDR